MRPGVGALLIALAVVMGVPSGRPQAAAQLIDVFQPVGLPTDQLDGLDWTFVRIQYSSWEDTLRIFRATYWVDPWAVDGPAAEQNLSRRLGRVTSIHVNDPITLRLEDDRLWEYPWIYFVEPGNLRLTSDEVGDPQGVPVAWRYRDVRRFSTAPPSGTSSSAR